MMPAMKTAELLLWILGATLLAVYAGARSWGEFQRQEGVISFVEARDHASRAPIRPLLELPRELPLAEPTRAGTGSMPAPTQDMDVVIALLRIPGIELEVPVYAGTADRILRLGAGLVEGTAMPGSHGNVGIAAHRDSHFRALKDVAVGDLIELGTMDGTQLYRVVALSVVDPGDVHVLDDTGESVLTLVTCYPFYFVGNAPQRFIVRAMPADGLM